jgi:hypothetical protein
MYSGTFLGLLDPEDEGRVLFRNISKYLPIDMAKVSEYLHL